MAKYEYWQTKEGLLKLTDWARRGLTDEQIAKNMGISRSTLAEWKNKYSDISDTLKKGKDEVDIEVENKLLKRALGYEYTETTSERVLNKETGEFEFVLTKSVTKEVVPDTTAQLFWLKNRRPEQWRDKKDIDVNGRLDTTAALTDEELAERIKKLKGRLGVELND